LGFGKGAGDGGFAKDRRRKGKGKGKGKGKVLNDVHKTYPSRVKKLMIKPHHLTWGKYTKEMVARITLVANKLYESVRKPEAATPQILKFHELRSSWYRSWSRA